MDITFHYPPELLNLLVDAIPCLCRSKDDVLLFFRGAGVPNRLMQDLAERVKTDRQGIRKAEIAREVLTRLNQKGEGSLRERREVLKRVVEFESFASCWPTDQLKAKGLVSEISRLVNVKDSFTRMRIEREQEARKHRAKREAQVKQQQNHRDRLAQLRSELLSLFKESNPWRRGKRLESVLNGLFKEYGVSVRESFTVRGDEGEGIVEQIDGVIELDGSLYLVEVKWWEKPLGKGDVSEHLINVFNRGHARGVFISASKYTAPAIRVCREALSKTTVVLCLLEEIVRLLEQEGDLKAMLKRKIQAAIVDKNPFHLV